MDTRSSIWLPCPLCIVNKEFGNNQAVPEIRTPRHLFRTWGLYRRLHLSRISVLSARCRYKTTRKKLWLYTVLFCFLLILLKSSSRLKSSNLLCHVPLHSNMKFGPLYGLKEGERWEHKMVKMVKKREGKKGLRRRKRIWCLSGNPLERVWNLILTKKNADCLYSDATNRHTNTQWVKWLYVNNSESN